MNERISLDKLCYSVLHIENEPTLGNLFRITFKKNIDLVLNNKIKELKAETVYISNKEQFDNYYLNNKDILVDKRGYTNYANEVGWKFGELGIWASNLNIWKKFIDSDYEYLLVIEDDVQLKPNFSEKLLEYTSELPEDWEIMTLFVGEYEYMKLFHKKDINDYKNICTSYHELNHSVVLLNRKTVLKILEKIKTPINLPIDLYFFRKPNDFITYSIKPTAEQICRIANALPSTFQNSHYFAPID
jgi:GR25 family glycosyltransferase involved in LPS biosynthesis